MSQIASAWRIAGGAFFKVKLSRGVVCDVKHACSCKACGHAFELVMIIVCFLSTVGVFVLLLNSKQMEKERKEVCAKPHHLMPMLQP